MIRQCPGAEMTRGTPWGRQCADGSSFECTPVLRSSNSAFAQGRNGTFLIFRSKAKFCGRPPYLLAGVQTPDRSGLPSGNRGEGAVRFGLPSRVRGILAGGTFAHCASRAAHSRRIVMEEAIIVFTS